MSVFYNGVVDVYVWLVIFKDVFNVQVLDVFCKFIENEQRSFFFCFLDLNFFLIICVDGVFILCGMVKLIILMRLLGVVDLICGLFCLWLMGVMKWWRCQSCFVRLYLIGLFVLVCCVLNRWLKLFWILGYLILRLLGSWRKFVVVFWNNGRVWIRWIMFILCFKFMSLVWCGFWVKSLLILKCVFCLFLILFFLYVIGVFFFLFCMVLLIVVFLICFWEQD